VANKIRRRKMAIKVIITRKVARGREMDLHPLLMELRTKAMEQKGYISGETLKGISDPDEFMVISTWNSLENWDAWNDNPDRIEIQEKIDAILEQKTVAKAYYYG
jgi:heme-degrading monooxygenase HmoA